MNTVEVRITGKRFDYGLKKAKSVGGKYNPGAKTWSIPADRNELNAPHLYSWVIVGTHAVPAPNPATTWVGVESMEPEDSIF